MTPSDQSNKTLLQFNGRNCFGRYHERFPKTLGMKKLKCYLANISSKIRKRTLNFMPASSKFFLKNSRRILQAFCFRCFCLLGACKKHFSCHLGYKNVKMKKNSRPNQAFCVSTENGKNDLVQKMFSKKIHFELSIRQKKQQKFQIHKTNAGCYYERDLEQHAQ